MEERDKCDAPVGRGNTLLTSAAMPSSHRFEPKAIKNKRKREEVFHKSKKDKGQAKLQRRLANAKREADDPKAKQVCMRCDAFESSHTSSIKHAETTGGECPPHTRKHARV